MIYLISDTHFMHEKLYEPRGFQTVDEMNEALIEAWNSRVKPADTVYHLGDFAFKTSQRHDDIVKIGQRLNGRKILILGNHDRYVYRKHEDWYEKFGFIMCSGYEIVQGLFLTHEPAMWVEQHVANVHGHLHDKNVIQGVNTSNHGEDVTPMSPSEKYINVSVEQLSGFAPISLEEIMEICASRGLDNT